MSDITTADLVRERGGRTVGTGGPLLLDDDDYPVTYYPININSALLFPSTASSGGSFMD
jgi:hypothetical protein